MMFGTQLITLLNTDLNLKFPSSFFLTIIPKVAHGVELLFERIDSMNVTCVDRFVDFKPNEMTSECDLSH